ncbi:MAG: NosD domain-containing protein, partial [Candidatus Thorarchaeota archaeon]
GLFLSSNDLGLRIDNSHDITVDGLHAEGISVTGAVYITFSTDVTVTNSYITSSNGFGLHVYRSNTTTIDDCEIENIGGGIGIHFENSLWCSAADNHLSTTGTSGIYLTNSNNTLLEANHLTDCEEYGIALQNSINVEIIDNDILNPLFNGIYCDIASHDGLIEGNHLTTPGLSAIVIVSANWTIQDNVITKCVYGIQITNSPDANIYRNDVSEASSQGIRILSCPDSDVVNNTVSMATQEGIYISGSPRSNLEGNIVTDIATGISLAQCVNSTISRNVVTRSSSISIRLYQSSGLLASENSIIDPDYLGMWTKYVTTSTFLDNTFTNGNFYFETQQTLAEVSHTFSGNTVNGLPLYYGLNQTGLTLNGASYGEIILVNCNDSSIEGGTFVDSGAVFLILFCDEVSINNVHGIDLSVGNMVWRSTNVELANSVFEGSSKFVGVAFLQSDNITMSNVNFTDVDDTNYASVLSENTPHFSISDSNFIRCDDAIEITWMGNFSITDCTFMDLDGNAIYANTAHYGVIKDNVIHGSAHGILVGGHHYIVENNEVWYANRAIWASGSNSHNATIRFNDLQSNNYGIYYEYADDWVITNNTIMWNYLYGIYQGSLVDSAQISYNIFLLNGLGNAYDGGSTQFWDDAVDTGNWWHDYDGTGPYDILGTAGSQDRYPMKYMVNLPIINQPPDIEYAEGSTGNEIVWSPFDDYLRDWVVKGDGVEWASGKWDFTPITVNIDGLAYGTHTFEITVWDVDQNFVSDTVVVHVYDDTPPVISGPANLWLFVDATGQTIEWEVADLHPDNYVLAVDDVEFRTGPWTSGILSINVDGIDEGEHLLLLTIYDIDGNLATDSFLVLVIDDNDNPTIEDAEDVIYLEGTTGNTLEWDADDAYPAFYEVSYNGTVVEDGAWGGSRIAFDVDGLDPGVHEFTLTVYDLSGNSAMNSANVTVIPLVPLQPPFLADWLVALIIGAAVGGVAVVVIIIYYLRKKRGS